MNMQTALISMYSIMYVTVQGYNDLFGVVKKNYL